MSTSDLFDVFGGEDNLRLMCEAENFRRSKGGSWACFELNHLWVQICLREPGVYGIFIQDTRRGRVVVNESYMTPEQTRGAFEEYTGYSLSF
jgi:hypothetical protein